MVKKKRGIFCAAVCLIVLLLSLLTEPAYSKYAWHQVGKLLHTVITSPPLTLTYMNSNGETVKTVSVGYGETVTVDQSDPLGAEAPQENARFDGWMNAAGARPAAVTVKRDLVLSAMWSIPDTYSVYFMDLEGKIVHQIDFQEGTTQITVDSATALKLGSSADEQSEKKTQELDLATVGLKAFVSWESYETNRSYADEGTHTIAGAADLIVNQRLSIGQANTGSASIYLDPAVDENGSIKDEDGDGLPDEYILTGASKDDSNIMIEIPQDILGGKVVGIADKAYYGFDSLHAVRIPVSVTAIGARAFSDKAATASGETITIYYDGSYEEWQRISKADGWDTGLGDGTNIFFLNGGDKVDSSQGYIDRTSSWWFGYTFGWEYKSTLNANFNMTYQADCNCEVEGCPRSPRPDAIYWPAR